MPGRGISYKRSHICEHADALCEQFGITKLYLFGSVAQGEDSLGSDIDFLAEFDSPTIIGFRS